MTFFVNAEGRLGGAAADMSKNYINAFGNELRCGVGGDLGFADIILSENLHFPAEDATFFVDVFCHQLRSPDAGDTVGSDIAAQWDGDSQLDGFRSRYCGGRY